MKYTALSDINLSASLCFQTPPGSWGHPLALSATQLWVQERCWRSLFFTQTYPKIPFTKLPSPCHHSCTWLISCCKLWYCQVSVGREEAVPCKKNRLALCHLPLTSCTSSCLFTGGRKLSLGWKICTAPRWTIHIFFFIPGRIFFLKDKILDREVKRQSWQLFSCLIHRWLCLLYQRLYLLQQKVFPWFSSFQLAQLF